MQKTLKLLMLALLCFNIRQILTNTEKNIELISSKQDNENTEIDKVNLTKGLAAISAATLWGYTILSIPFFLYSDDDKTLKYQPAKAIIILLFDSLLFNPIAQKINPSYPTFLTISAILLSVPTLAAALLAKYGIKKIRNSRRVKKEVNILT